MALQWILALTILHAPAGHAARPAEQEPQVIAVYSGAEAGAPQPLIAWLEEGLAGVRGRALGPAQIAAGGLEGTAAVVFPGSRAEGRFEALGETGRAAVVSFVSAGGGYVGFCAGALLAASAPEQGGLGLLDALIVDHGQGTRGSGSVEVELSPAGQGLFGWSAGRLPFYYDNGPLFAPRGSGDIPDYEALAWFRTGIGEGAFDPALMVDTPAVIAGRFGAGRVLVSSGHAEWSEGIEESFLRSVEWACGRVEWVAATAPGALVAAGGGELGAEVYERGVALARERWPGREVDVVVLPQASQRVAAGTETAARWLAAGASSARVLRDLSGDDWRRGLEAAEVIWFTGGSQRRLMAALREGACLELVRARHRAGCVVGGTSAGAAVLSATMISGAPEPAPLHAGAMRALAGLGLWPEGIVDQHFRERGRFDRLLGAVLDQPRLLGVGISEGTAVVVDGHRLQVLGAGLVTLIDAREALVPAAEAARLQTARDVKVALLEAGESLPRRAVRR